MKKLIIITIALFLSANIFTSCTKEKGDNPDCLTARGMTITSEWDNAINYILYCYANISFQLHNHIENRQDNIEENGLKMQDIGSGIWNVYINGEIAYTINTYGQSLDSIGAKWELTSLANYNDFGLRQDDYSVNFSITCIAENSWNIYSKNEDIPEYFFDVNISCKNTPTILNNYAFVFSGEGNLYLTPNYYYYDYYYDAPYYNTPDFSERNTRYEPYFPELNESVDLNFKTEVDMNKTSYGWSKGIININVQNREEETSSTRAEFFRKGYEYIVKITYGGVTEEWYED